MSDHDHYYSAVRFEQFESVEKWLPPAGLRGLLWRLRGSRRPHQPWSYYDGLRHTLKTLVDEFEAQGVVPKLGTIRIMANYEPEFMSDYALADCYVDGNKVSAPAIPSSYIVQED